MDTIELRDIADDLLIVNKKTVDTLFKLENCADCIALYVFYYKTAKWQKTNTIKACDMYVKKSLKWGADRVKNAKMTLKEHGLIDLVQRRNDEGKIEGWFIRISYMVTMRKIEDTSPIIEKSQNSQNPQVDQATSGSQDTNALKEKIKCLNKEIEMLKKEKPAQNELETEFDELWAEYPKKQGKTNALRAYIKARKAGVDKDTIFDGIIAYKAFLEANKTDFKYIKQGSTWFNQQCWADDYEIKARPASKPLSKQDQEYLDYLDSLG